VPLFVTVTDLFSVPDATVPKASVAGDKLTSVLVPVTFKIACETFGSPEKVAVIVPGITPSVNPGLKTTLNTHVPLAARTVFPDRLQTVPVSPVVFRV